ncbi:hypothetical protein ACFYY2_23895 [Streptomyces sp. NPDC001822]|uniref:hypothetical protein n=1 Tax=Streptomyces sp. NPDC001822 TaxID=3364614 RepID=UPI0036CCE39C
MDDLLLALAVPAVVLASGVYAVCDCRRTRRNPPLPYTRRAARAAAHDVLSRAEAVVGGAYNTLGGLYTDPAAPHPAQDTPVVTGRRAAGPDPGPSRPAPARRP